VRGNAKKGGGGGFRGGVYTPKGGFVVVESGEVLKVKKRKKF